MEKVLVQGSIGGIKVDVPESEASGNFVKSVNNVLPDENGNVNVSGSLPAGGTEGQVLTKNSSTDGDASWKNVPSELPPMGDTNHMKVLSVGGGDVPEWSKDVLQYELNSSQKADLLDILGTFLQAALAANGSPVAGSYQFSYGGISYLLDTLQKGRLISLDTGIGVLYPNQYSTNSVNFVANAVGYEISAGVNVAFNMNIQLLDARVDIYGSAIVMQ